MKLFNFLRHEWLILTLVSIPFLILAFYVKEIPNQIPIHWDLEGQANGYGSKYVMPVINLGLYALLLFMPTMDPRQSNYKLFSSSYRKIRMIVALFFSTLISLGFVSYLGYDMEHSTIMLFSIYLLLTAFGNYFGTIKPNWFIGIRTPWTLENEDVWKKTHAVAGKLWFFLGLSGIAITLLVQSPYLPIVHGILFGVMAITPIVHSYILFKRYQDA
ncbi:MAG: SdpI family protein [Flavobacteriales bacterium]|nr:SdpI family protein [Flavobacteriales bacterium]